MTDADRIWIEEYYPGVFEAFPDWNASIDKYYNSGTDSKSFKCLDLSKGEYEINLFRDSYEDGTEEFYFSIYKGNTCKVNYAEFYYDNEVDLYIEAKKAFQKIEE